MSITKVKQLVGELVAQGRWDEAYAVLANHVTRQPQDLEGQLQMGLFCYQFGRYQESERCLRLALEGPSPQDATFHLGLSLLKLGRPQEAMAAFRDACEITPDFAVGHLHWGLALSAMSSWRGALGQFKQAVKLRPELVAAHYQAGLAAYHLEAYEESIGFFERAAELDPDLAEAFHGAGVARTAMGDLEGAAAEFERACRVDSSRVDSKLSWAQALINLGRFEEAWRHYQDLVGTASISLDARERCLIYNDWGVGLFRQSRLDDAAEKLLHATSVDPGFLDARLNLGLVQTALNEFEQAYDAFGKAVEAAPHSGLARMHLGITAFLLDRYEEALDCFTSAISMGADCPLLRLWLGYTDLVCRRFRQAEEHFRKALEEDPGNAMALDALGASLAFQSLHTEAIEKFQECIRKDPSYALAHLHLARSYEAAGRGTEAMSEYKTAVSKDPRCLEPEKEVIENLLKHSQYELVQSKLKRILEIAPDDEEAVLALARSLKGQQRMEDAMAVVDRLLAVNPESAQGYVLAGQLYLSQGLLLDADEKFRMASQLYEGDVALYYGWGKTLGLLGLHELALEKFQKANEIDPFDADTYEAWGATLKILGRYQDAAEVYRKAADYI